MANPLTSWATHKTNPFQPGDIVRLREGQEVCRLVPKRLYHVYRVDENFVYLEQSAKSGGWMYNRFELVSQSHIVLEPSPEIDAKPMLLPTDAEERKNIPITSGVLDYFPLAIAAVAKLSKAGNDQHNPGQPLHWAKEKSADHADCIARHLIDRNTFDSDGQRHAAKLAWRALALLQTILEEEAA